MQKESRANEVTVDVEFVLAELGIAVVSRSNNELRACCPDFAHQDTKPSWSINKTTGQHYCQACGFKGNLHTLIKYKGLELSELSVASITPQQVEEVDEAEQREREREYEVRYQALPSPPSSALKRRRISQESAERFGIRWLVDSWVIPIHDRSGRLRGYQTKSPHGYINTPGTKKSRYLFGMHLLDISDEVVVVESPLDVARLAELGIPAVATFGTGVSDVQFDLIRSFRSAVIAMDDDEAGWKSGLSFLPKLRRVRFADYRYSKGEKDLGEMQASQIRNVVGNAVPRSDARAMLSELEHRSQAHERTSQGRIQV